MAISVPQTKNGDFVVSSASLAVSFTAGIAAGSIIVVAGQFDQNTTSVTLSDGHGDTVTDSGLGLITDAATTSKSFVKAFFSPATGAQTITATYSGTNPTFGDMYIWEVAGLTSAQFDKVVDATGTGTAANSGSSGTLSNANEACFGYGATSSSFTTAGSTWTSDGVTPNTGSIGEHKVVSVNTAITATATLNSGNWIMWLATVMSGGTATLPNNQKDWPNPQPILWSESWTWRQVGYIGQDKLPNRQRDWPNPVPVLWNVPWVWRQVDKLGLDKLPNRQQDWPNPTPVTWYQSHTFSRQIVPSTQAPFNQLDWPNPQPILWTNGSTWRQVDKLGQDKLPNRQQDWPNPQPISWYNTWSSRYSLYGQDTLPNRQQDWPVPPPVQWYQDHRVNLLQTTLFTTAAPLPFNQYAWPLPRTPEFPTLFFSSSPFPPPLPPPPVVTQTGGWTEWTETDVANQAHFWKKTAQLENYYQNIRKSAQELGKKGGEARMKTMTAFERQTYAKAAAQARWGKK